MTYYVNRNKRGDIVGAWSNPQYRTQDAVPPSNSGLIKYINSTPLGQRLAAMGLTVDDIKSLSVRGPGMYIDRGADGQVVGAWDTPRRDGQELVPLDDAALQAFLSPAAADVAA